MGTRGGGSAGEGNFLRRVDEILRGLDARALKARLREHAAALPPRERAAFLGMIEGDARAAFEERRRAFRAAPGLATLTPLLDTAVADPDRRRRIVRAELAGAGSRTKDRRLLARMELLAGRYGDAIERFDETEVLGWSRPGNPGYVVFGFLVHVGSGLDRPPEHSAIEAVWRRMDAGERSGPARAYAEFLLEHLERWPVSAVARLRFRELASAAARERVRAILESRRRDSYGKAAECAVACAEAHRLGGERGAARSFLDGLNEAFPHHRAFRRELRAAEVRFAVLPAMGE